MKFNKIILTIAAAALTAVAANAEVYLVKGDKIVATYADDAVDYITFVKPATPPPTEVTYVDLGIELEPNASWAWSYLPFDVNEVLTTLGAPDVPSCRVVAYDADGNVPEYTAENNGYWFAADGTIGWWNNSNWAIFYKGDAAAKDDAKYSNWCICLNPSTKNLNGIAKIGFEYNGKVLMYAIEVTVLDEKPVEATNIVETRSMEVTLPVNTGDYAKTYATFEADSVVAKLGATAITDCKVASYGADNKAIAYSANNGYWYNTDGSVGAWGASAGWCIEFDATANAAAWQMCAYPNVSAITGVSKIGFEYKGKALMFDITVTLPTSAE